MRNLYRMLAVCLLGTTTLAGAALADAPKKEPTGKELAFDRSKGNCLACHTMPGVPDAESAGHYGPPLIAMSARFPERAKLRAQIWDATANNPNSVMPPFGKHHILNDAEIDKITDFVHGL